MEEKGSLLSILCRSSNFPRDPEGLILLSSGVKRVVVRTVGLHRPRMTSRLVSSVGEEHNREFISEYFPRKDW